MVTVQPQSSPLTMLVYVQDGCGACEEYLPRFRKIYRALKREGLTMPELMIVDLGHMDAENTKWADVFGVRFTPTTVGYKHNGRWRKFEHQLDDQTIEHLLRQAAARCEIA